MTKHLDVPLKNPRPDVGRFMRAITTDYQPPRPPLIEYILDEGKYRAVTEMLGRTWSPGGRDPASRQAYLDNFIAFWRHMGYDIVRLELSLPFPRPNRPGAVAGRHFAETGKGCITSWTEFESYPWPDTAAFDYSPLEYIATHLPEGMGLITNHAGGPFELLSQLMGYQTLCLTVYDDPKLVTAVADKVGSLMEAYVRHLLSLPNLVAIFPGDDMGFRSGTLLAPDQLRQYTLPWHRRFAAMTHKAGLKYFLHSCGQLADIMPDLIDDIGIDAKHSYEDAITPVAQAKKLWGSRIGILGGVDVDTLTRGSPGQVRAYVRRIIDACAPGGHFAIGSGNSIPDYVPLENYMTMVDEALKD